MLGILAQAQGTSTLLPPVVGVFVCSRLFVLVDAYGHRLFHTWDRLQLSSQGRNADVPGLLELTWSPDGRQLLVADEGNSCLLTFGICSDGAPGAVFNHDGSTLSVIGQEAATFKAPAMLVPTSHHGQVQT